MIDVRAVWVTGTVGEGVMLAMCRDPLRHRALHGRGAEDRRRCAKRPAGLEAAVREQTVEADGHADDHQDIADDQHEKVLPVQRSSPRQPDRHAQQREWHNHDHDVRKTIRASRDR